MTTDKTTGQSVFHVVGGYNGFHIVSAETLARASRAQEEADAAPYYENFGDLRRSGDLAQLAERLEGWDLSLDDYVSVIERAAERPGSSADLADRLAAVADVDFAGDDDANAPADHTDFRSEHERESEVEDVYMSIIEGAMLGDVPEDVLQTSCRTQSPRFSDGPLSRVEPEQLDEMITALEARGYTVINE